MREAGRTKKGGPSLASLRKFLLSRSYLFAKSSYFFYQSFQDIFCLFFFFFLLFYKGIFSCQDTPYIVLQLFNLFFYFFFFQPFIGLGQAFQGLLQILFQRQRRERERYTRYTLYSSRQFLFCRFLFFFFRRRLRMSSFFSYPKQASRKRRLRLSSSFSCPKQVRRRRKERKSEYRLIITYFYKRFLFRPIRPWHFIRLLLIEEKPKKSRYLQLVLVFLPLPCL